MAEVQEILERNDMDQNSKQELVSKIVEAVQAWPGISVAPHRFGGQEFRLGKREVGHIHRHGMVDIPFHKSLRDVLVAEGLAEAHHLLADSGWITYYVRTEHDVKHAIWLYRLAYLATTLTMRRQRINHPDTEAVDIEAVGGELNLQGDLRNTVDDMLSRLSV
jgi:hypothetical protein